MNDNFDDCLKFVLQWEGDYIYDPDDPGGETNFGISKRSHPTLDIGHLTLDQAREIYKNEYWFPSSCQKFTWPYDIIIFDTAVNLGQKRAGILLQEHPGWPEYLLARIEYYLIISHKTHDKYLRGWIARVIDLNTTIRNKNIS